MFPERHPKLVHEGEVHTEDQERWEVINRLVREHAVLASKATEREKEKAEWKVVVESDPSRGIWGDAFYMKPGESSYFMAGKIAQLGNQLEGYGRHFEIRKVEKK
jgi:2-hydroxychromene-2-carboxylate isomerase